MTTLLVVAALLPAKSQRFLKEFSGPKIQLRQQLMASPGYSRLVTWVTVGGILRAILGKTITPLAIRTPGNNHKGRPILV